jgi:hypothetical protein
MIMPLRGRIVLPTRACLTRWPVRQCPGPTPPKNVSFLNPLVLLIGLIRLSVLRFLS